MLSKPSEPSTSFYERVKRITAGRLSDQREPKVIRLAQKSPGFVARDFSSQRHPSSKSSAGLLSLQTRLVARLAFGVMAHMRLATFGTSCASLRTECGNVFCVFRAHGCETHCSSTNSQNLLHAACTIGHARIACGKHPQTMLKTCLARHDAVRSTLSQSLRLVVQRARSHWPHRMGMLSLFAVSWRAFCISLLSSSLTTGDRHQ